MNDALRDYQTVCSPAVDDWALDWALEAHRELTQSDGRLPAFDPAAWCGYRPRSYCVTEPRPWWARAWGRP